MGSKFGSTETLKVNYNVLPNRMPKFWSYTRWVAFNKCKLFYLLAYCHKIKQPDSYHLARGIDIHAKAEAFLKGEVKGIPRELAQFRKPFAAVKKAGAVAEQNITLTKSFGLTTPTDWAHAWLRIKIDILMHEEGSTHVDFIDVKTGKNRGEYQEQEEIYGMGCFTYFPKVKTLDTEYWFVDSGEVESNSFDRKQYPALKKKWRKNAATMIDCTKFPAEPSDFGCGYCPFRSDKKLPNGEPGMCDKWQKG